MRTAGGIVRPRLVWISLVGFVLIACSPRRVEAPVYRYDSDALTLLSAGAHARDAGGFVARVMPTGSMRPAIADGDLVVALGPQKAPFASISEGDVLLYDADWLPAGSPPVLHRAAMRDAGGWIMSGDNTAHYENKHRVTPRNYIGKVIAIYRKAP